MNNRVKVSDKNKWFLWAKSAGRCQYPGCNKALWKDPTAISEFNSAYIAHIIATSPRGPRGYDKLSTMLADKLSNLMLLCDSHHRLIDREDVENHPVDKLKEFKKAHEIQIENLTSLISNQSTKIIIYSANIGIHNTTMDRHSVRRATLPEKIPSLSHIEISLKNSSMQDDQKSYWISEIANLEEAYKQRIKPYLEDEEFKHLTFFGLAPIPLLIKFGVLLSDISDVEVRQLMKEPKTWQWDSKPSTLNFTIQEPIKINAQNDIALVISTSAKISHERITPILPNADIWEIKASDIHNDNIRTKESLTSFRKIFRRVLAQIKSSYPMGKHISIFPAVSVAVATEMGRVWNGKSDLPMSIYDNNHKKGGFEYALTIEEKQ